MSNITLTPEAAKRKWEIAFSTIELENRQSVIVSGFRRSNHPFATAQEAYEAISQHQSPPHSVMDYTLAAEREEQWTDLFHNQEARVR